MTTVTVSDGPIDPLCGLTTYLCGAFVFILNTMELSASRFLMDNVVVVELQKSPVNTTLVSGSRSTLSPMSTTLASSTLSKLQPAYSTNCCIKIQDVSTLQGSNPHALRVYCTETSVSLLNADKLCFCL